MGIQAEAFRLDLAEVWTRVAPSVVTITGNEGAGAGLVWNRAGLVITNDHVARSDRVNVQSSDGTNSEGWVVARDRELDLAALASQPHPGDQPIEVGDPGRLRVGSVVVAIGHPLGWRYSPSVGIVSAHVSEPWISNRERRLLKLDVALAPGNSGGPIVDAEGKLVGVACMIAFPGIALAIPAPVVSAFAEWAQTRMGAAA